MYSNVFIYRAFNLLGCFLVHGVIYQADSVRGPNEQRMELFVVNPELWKIVSEGTQESKTKLFFG